MAFVYRQDNGRTLTPLQAKILESIENQPSPFQGINSLKDLRTLTGLSVVVTDRDRLREILYKAKSDTESVMAVNNKMYNLAGEDIKDRIRWLNELLENSILLGLYSRKLFWFDGDKPTVYLFADNIKAYASKKEYREEHVFGFVFIHEMMHAYYDAFNSVGFPAKEPLEEAFAEFGMLTFINKTLGPGPFLEEARASVSSKIDNGPREYGFGFELFTGTSGGDPEMISDYRKISNWIDYPAVRRFPKDYFDCIEEYMKNPDDNHASDCIEGVKYILNHKWHEPDRMSRIQPGIGKRVIAVSPLKTSTTVSSTVSAASKKSAPGTLSADRYWIFDLTSRELVDTTSATARVPLLIIKALLKRNPTLTYNNLDRLFNPVHNSHLPNSLGIVSKKGDVASYYHTTYTSKGLKIRSRFYDNDPIILATGDIVLVTNQWSLKTQRHKDDFEEFLYVAQYRPGFFVYDSWSK